MKEWTRRGRAAENKPNQTGNEERWRPAHIGGRQPITDRNAHATCMEQQNAPDDENGDGGRDYKEAIAAKHMCVTSEHSSSADAAAGTHTHSASCQMCYYGIH